MSLVGALSGTRRSGKTTAMVAAVKCIPGAVLICFSDAEAHRVAKEHGIETTSVHAVESGRMRGRRTVALIDPDAAAHVLMRQQARINELTRELATLRGSFVATENIRFRGRTVLLNEALRILRSVVDHTFEGDLLKQISAFLERVRQSELQDLTSQREYIGSVPRNDMADAMAYALSHRLRAERVEVLRTTTPEGLAPVDREAAVRFEARREVRDLCARLADALYDKGKPVDIGAAIRALPVEP